MKRFTMAVGLGLGLFALCGAGCTAGGKKSTFGDGAGDGGGATLPPTGGGGAATTPQGGAGGIFDPGDDGGTGVTCTAGPDEDYDGDGFTITAGDCNDCDENVNPHAIEVPTDPEDPEATAADENCNGEVDEPIPTCDDTLGLEELAPVGGAHAIDLCHDAATDGYGVVSAQYVRANGAPANPGVMVGILQDFGPNVLVRRGARLLALSSGHARLPGQPGACAQNSCNNGLTGTAPPNFPQDVPGCDGDSEIYDDVALELVLRSPKNANGYSFDFSFYTFEYPEWVCTSFNDQFIALVNPAPPGSINGNISFDSQANPVSVNIAMFDVCPGCPQGTAALSGNGFDGAWSDDAGATGWLVTSAPVEGGVDFSIRFAIWDTGDQAWDSTTIIDNFTWIANAGTVAVGTIPVPN